MAKDRSRFVCQACGAVSPKWQGRCDACGDWNTLIEETTAPRGPGPAAKTAGGRRVEFVGLKGESAPPPRIVTGIAELDRVLGGGFVPASALEVAPALGRRLAKSSEANTSAWPVCPSRSFARTRPLKVSRMDSASFGERLVE